MPQGHAVSYESIARVGRLRTSSWCSNLHSPWKLRHRRGPDLALQQAARERESRLEVQRLLDGARSLVVTIASDVDPQDAHAQRLMHLARLGDVTVFRGSTFESPPVFKAVRTWRLQPSPQDAPGDRDFGAVVESDTSTTIHHVFLQSGWRRLAAHAAGDVPTAEQLWIDLRFHESAKHDLFVTNNVELLGDRRYHNGQVGSKSRRLVSAGTIYSKYIEAARRCYVRHITLDALATTTLPSDRCAS